MIDPFLQASGVNSTFHGGVVSFQDYITQCQTLISLGRSDLQNNPLASTIIAANSPYEWRPQQLTRKGVLLIHGLFDSPFTLRDLGQNFLAQGFLVRSVLLPGHGTVPGDLLTITYQEWLRAVQFAINSLASEVDEIYLAGYSLGGAIAIHEALQNSAIKGLILLAPALKAQRSLATFGWWVRLFSHVYKSLLWYQRLPQINYVRYESFATNAAYQALRLMQRTAKLTRRTILNIPIFMVVSTSDESANAQAAINFFVRNSNNCSRLLVYSNHASHYADIRITLKNSHYPQQRILDFSHTSIPIAPENPYYGVNGVYQDFQHYKNKKDDKRPLHYGAIRPDYLKKYFIQRLGYNPDFAGMTTALNEFLKTIS